MDPGRDERLSHAVLADNATGATFAASETFLEDALFVGESANNASVLSAGTPRRGYEFYDGRVGADRVTFVNFTAAGSIPSSALGFNRNNGFSVSTANFAGALPVPERQSVLPRDAARRQGRRQGRGVPRPRRGRVGCAGRVHRGQHAVPDHAELYAARPDWNAYVCLDRYVGLQVRSDAETVAPLTHHPRRRGGADAGGRARQSQHARSPRMRPRRGYTIQYAGTVPLRPRISLSRTLEGEWARVTLPYPQAALKVTRDFNSSQPLPAAASLAELDGEHRRPLLVRHGHGSAASQARDQDRADLRARSRSSRM